MKSKNILLRVQKGRPVKAQIKTSIENDVNKAILSRGEKVVNPACCCVLKEKVNYFSFFFFFFFFCMCGVSAWWGEILLQEMNG